MSDFPITGLPDASTPLSGAEYVVIVQNGIVCKVPLNQIVILASYAKAALPTAVLPTRLIYVVDDVGGAVPAFNDGTSWRRITDRAVIS